MEPAKEPQKPAVEPKPEERFCTGRCAHSESFHVVKCGTDLACSKMDCGCMQFVPRPIPKA